MRALSSIFFLSWALTAPALAQSESPEASGKLQMTLRSRAYIPGHRIQLGDLFHIKGPDPKKVRKVQDLEYANAPSGNWARAVKRSDLTMWLAEHDLGSSQVEISGAEAVSILADTVRVEAETLVSSAEAVLRQLLAKEGASDTTWKLLGNPRGINVPRGRSSRKLIAKLKSPNLETGHASFSVEIIIDGKLNVIIPIQFELQRFADLLVATKLIRRGEAFTDDNVTVKRVRWTKIQGDPFEFPGQVIGSGRIAAKQLRPNQVVTNLHVQLRPIISKGDQIQVVAIVGRVRIATRGIAQSDARKGERVPILLSGKKTPVYAEAYATGIAVIRTPSNRIDLSKIR
ncbi:MAG: flagella basal body P-ring formation protein FlgA [Planctomycetota bacterium]|nr:MAG: flagella basal body P-ring formation protein FlgA [Planctomycetota bacterium]